MIFSKLHKRQWATEARNSHTNIIRLQKQLHKYEPVEQAKANRLVNYDTHLVFVLIKHANALYIFFNY